METETGIETNNTEMETGIEKILEEKAALKEIEEAAANAPPMPIANIKASSEVYFFDLSEVDYDAKYNVRIDYEDRVNRTYSRLLADRIVKVPLQVAKMADQPEKYFRGVSGFLRHRALGLIKEKNPDVWKEWFEGKVPYRVYTALDGSGITEEARERLMMDHGAEEPLKTIEVLETQARLMRVGRSQRDICNILAALYYQLSTISVRNAYDIDVQKIMNGEKVVKGQEMCGSIWALNGNIWKGRFQRFQRIIEAPPVVLKLHKERIAANAQFTQSEIEKLTKCQTDEEALALVESFGKMKNTEGRSLPKMWNRSQVESALATCKSNFFRTQLQMVLGVAEAGERLLTMEEQLVRIETAMAQHPNFWELIS